MVDEIQEIDMVAKAEAMAEKLRQENERMAEQLKKLEAIETRNILGGRTSVAPVEKPREETPAEYAKRMLRGGA